MSLCGTDERRTTEDRATQPLKRKAEFRKNHFCDRGLQANWAPVFHIFDWIILPNNWGITENMDFEQKWGYIVSSLKFFM